MGFLEMFRNEPFKNGSGRKPLGHFLEQLCLKNSERFERYSYFRTSIKTNYVTSYLFFRDSAMWL